MQGDGYDRAHALLEPFRFGFPRIIIGIAVFSEKVLKGFDPDKRITKSVNDALLAEVRKSIPAGRVELEGSGDVIVLQKHYFYTLQLSAARRADLTLFKTVAMYAGSELPLPGSKVFWTAQEEVEYDDDWQCEYYLRWYVKIIDDSRFSREISGKFDKLVQFRVCDDPFAASWTILNERVGKHLTTDEVASPDQLGKRASEALEIIRSDGPIQGKALAKRIHIEFSTFRKHIVPQLKACGVKNDGRGYYVAPM
jgi:hypothetical protein